MKQRRTLLAACLAVFGYSSCCGDDAPTQACCSETRSFDCGPPVPCTVEGEECVWVHGVNAYRCATRCSDDDDCPGSRCCLLEPRGSSCSDCNDIFHVCGR